MAEHSAINETFLLMSISKTVYWKLQLFCLTGRTTSYLGQNDESNRHGGSQPLLQKEALQMDHHVVWQVWQSLGMKKM